MTEDDYYYSAADTLAPPLLPTTYKFHHDETYHPVVFPCIQNLASRYHHRQSLRVAAAAVVD
jgi:hypothetical protein